MLELEGMPSFFFVYEICLFFKEGIFYYALHLVYTLFFVISIFLGRELFFLPSLTPSFFHPIFVLCAPALHRHFFSKRKFPRK